MAGTHKPKFVCVPMSTPLQSLTPAGCPCTALRQVPLSSAVAMALRQREEEEAREREEMKRLVLAANRCVGTRTGVRACQRLP